MSGFPGPTEGLPLRVSSVSDLEKRLSVRAILGPHGPVSKFCHGDGDYFLMEQYITSQH